MLYARDGRASPACWRSLARDLLRLARAAWSRWRCARTSCASSTSAPRCARRWRSTSCSRRSAAASAARSTVLALGHIEPNFSYWTTSGEFVFVAILAGCAQRRRGVRRLARARAGALVLQPLLPEHLAARARPVPAARDPLPAAAASARCWIGARPARARCAERRANAPCCRARGLEQALRRGGRRRRRSTSTSPPGERVSLIGSNGAGKTTFVNMVTGYLKPDAGHIALDGRDITRAGAARDHAPAASRARSRSRSSAAT